MISIEQIRAARAYLGWNQNDLADASGVNKNTIASLEQGRVRNPGVDTLGALHRAFVGRGIAFRDGGVVPKTDPTTKFEGEGWYLRLLDDVYTTLIDSADPEAIVLFGDESQSPSEVLQRWRKIKNLGTKVRRIVRQGDTHLTGALNEYRYMPAAYFNNYVIIVYGEKVAICAGDNTMALVIDDAALSQSYKMQTNYYFDTLEQPTESRADERI